MKPKTSNFNLKTSAHALLILLSMLYMMLLLCNTILTNRYIGSDASFVLGGAFTSPFIFILDDIVAEIFGYKLTQAMILFGFTMQSFFVLICLIVLQTPYPSFFNAQEHYSYVLGSSLLKFNICGFFAYIVANLLNSYLITRWKILLQGKHFWMRSIGASTIAEALYSLLAILMMEFQYLPLKNILHIATLSFVIKFSYSVFFAIPAQFTVSRIKSKVGIDTYQFPKNLTPFKYNT